MVFLVSTAVVIFAPLHGCLPKCVGDRMHTRIIAGTLQTSSLRRIIAERGVCVVGVRSVFDKGMGTSAIRSVSSLAVLHSSSLVRHAERRRRFHGRCRRSRQCGLATISSGGTTSKLVFCHPAQNVVSSGFSLRGERCNISVTTGPGRDILTALSKAIVLSACATRANCIVRVRRKRSFISICGRYNSLLGGRKSPIGNNRTVTLMKGANRGAAKPRLRFRL